MGKIIKKMKKRWGVNSTSGLLLILFIFAITGMSVLYVRKFAFGWLGFNAQTPLWLEVIAWIAIVFPSYQLLLLFYGLILGQFEFVWNFEKKSLLRIKSLFVKNNS